MAGPAYYSGVMNISKNEDWVVPFVFYQLDENGENPVPVDLTGSRLLLQLRTREADHEALVSVDSQHTGGIMITSAPLGQFEIIIETDLLVRLSPGDYFCDLIRFLPNGWQERIWEGTATVVEGTSREGHA